MRMRETAAAAGAAVEGKCYVRKRDLSLRKLNQTPLEFAAVAAAAADLTGSSITSHNTLHRTNLCQSRDPHILLTLAGA